MTAFDLAQRYVGIQEIAGQKDHPLIQWWLSLCGFPTTVHDEVPWCSAFVNGICWELRLPRTKSAAARSWLSIGVPTPLMQAQAGFDVAVFWRGSTVNDGTGHVGFFAGSTATGIAVLGGNQADGVRIEILSTDKLLGIRRLA